MRMRSVFVIVTLLIMLSPILSINGTSQNEEEILIANDLDSDIGVLAGDIFYYNINQLTLPSEVEIDNVTLPDFAGNQIYVKVLYIEENYHYDYTTFGAVIHFAVGFKFAKDTTFEFDFSLLDSTDITIPKGATTPSVTSVGNPHFEDTLELGPAMFFMNSNWDSHVLELEALGFTVTNVADELSAVIYDGAGVITITWRKSDGALTHLMIEDIAFLDNDFSDSTVEISLDEKEHRPLGISIGDQIEIEAEYVNFDFSVSGEIATDINETDISEELVSYEALTDHTILRLIVDEIYGVYYVCSVWVIDDLETFELERLDDKIYFNGFQGASDIESFLPNFDSSDEIFFGSVIVPAITPDWDIYKGFMTLGNTLIGFYCDEVIEALQPEIEHYETIHTFDVTFGFSKRQDYYYYQVSMETDIDINQTYYYNQNAILDTMDTYAIGVRVETSTKMYVAYHETGVFAGMRIKQSSKQTAYDYIGATNYDTGTTQYEFDIKLRNIDFNPPDAFVGGFIPGFRWLLIIPALLPITTYRFVSRRRK